MAGVARDGDAAPGRAVGQFAADRRDCPALQSRSADAASPNAHRFVRAGPGHGYDLERIGRDGIDFGFDDREIVAGNERQDARREGFRAFAEAHAERAVGGDVFRGQDADPVAEAGHDRPRTHAVIVTGIGHDHDRTVALARRDGRSPKRARGEGERRERGDECESGWLVQDENSAFGVRENAGDALSSPLRSEL
jgi:hypothetical protein